MPELDMEHLVNLPTTESGLYSLVLAAGSASRFGGLKQLAQYQNESLVRRALRLGTQLSGRRTVLVVGAEWQRVVEDCGTLAPFVVRNEIHASGMASSIACGARAVQPVADAVMILLADQPLITLAHLQMLKETWRAAPSSIVTTEFAEISGPPVIFPKKYVGELAALSGNVGARAVMQDHSEAVVKILFADAAVDIDTPDDLHRL